MFRALTCLLHPSKVETVHNLRPLSNQPFIIALSPSLDRIALDQSHLLHLLVLLTDSRQRTIIQFAQRQVQCVS